MHAKTLTSDLEKSTKFVTARHDTGRMVERFIVGLLVQHGFHGTPPWQTINGNSHGVVV
jgi:hypothetical protein